MCRLNEGLLIYYTESICLFKFFFFFFFGYISLVWSRVMDLVDCIFWERKKNMMNICQIVFELVLFCIFVQSIYSLVNKVGLDQ